MVSAGRILIMPKGDWNNLTTYDMLDLVAYNGVAYLARASSTGQNPSTDTSMTYWQPFGSASAIATTTTPGLVMPDDETIKIDAYGKINVNIDNSTLVYDTTNHYLKAVISNALADLTDTNIASAQAGQVLAYDSVSQKWENTTLYGDGIALSSLDATTITSAISALQAPTFTEAVSRTNVASGDTTPTLWGKVKKWFTDLKGGAFLDTNVSGGLAKSDDLASIYATGSTNATGSTISAGTYFYLDGVLVRAKADIANGATFTLNTNYEVVSAGALNELEPRYRVVATANANQTYASQLAILNTAFQALSDDEKLRCIVVIDLTSSYGVYHISTSNGVFVRNIVSSAGAPQMATLSFSNQKAFRGNTNAATLPEQTSDTNTGNLILMVLTI